MQSPVSGAFLPAPLHSDRRPLDYCLEMNDTDRSRLMSTVRLPLRFRLSSLMIVVTVLSILLGRWVYLADQQE